MEYTVRELKATDLGPVCKILSKIGIRQFKDCFNNIDFGKEKSEDKNELTDAQVGLSVMIEMASIITENMDKAQMEINTFLSSVTGLKVEAIENLSLSDYMDLIIEVLTKADFKDFFNRAMKLLGQ
ncbi:MAG: hypothetical protein E7A81_06855 [Clostridiales bacterium]|nr:hypothetical protein [Clostridiales bacterium]MDU1042719.1 hypothetical protein [Clostridiales bacterium]MDU3490450.1 hypothetical protein [Clostridiales bacterium]